MTMMENKMHTYTVRYSLGAYVYESYVRCASTDAAMMWVRNSIPSATNIKVENKSDV